MKIATATALLCLAAACTKQSTAPADSTNTTTTTKAPPVNDPNAIPAPPDVAAAPADVEKTASGLASKQLTAGAGTEHPTEHDTVRVNYTGWTLDGHMFDSSVTRGEPAVFPLDRVIKGWTEGLQLMVVGEKRRFWIPAELAYGGTTPRRPGAPAGMLVFDVELLGILKATECSWPMSAPCPRTPRRPRPV